MKNFLSILIAVMLFGSIAFAGEGREGGGGSGCMAEIMQTVAQLNSWLKSSSGKSHFDARTFEQAANPTLFKFVDDSTKLTYKGNPVDALFDGQVVQINCARFLRNTPKARSLLVAHEVFRKLGVEGDNYEITRNLNVSPSEKVVAQPKLSEGASYGPLYGGDSTLNVVWKSEKDISASVYLRDGRRIDYRINNKDQSILVYEGQNRPYKDRGYLQFQAQDRVVFYKGGKLETYRTGAPVQCMELTSGRICVGDSVADGANIGYSRPYKLKKILRSSDSTYINFVLDFHVVPPNPADLVKVAVTGCLRGVCMNSGENIYFLEGGIFAQLYGFIGNSYLVESLLPVAMNLTTDTLYDLESVHVTEFNTGNRCNEVSTAEESRIKERLQKDVMKKCSGKTDHCLPTKAFYKTETTGGSCIFSSSTKGYRKAGN